MKLKSHSRKIQRILISCILLFGVAVLAQKSVKSEMITEKQHPRILLFKGDEALIRQPIDGDPVWRKMHEAIVGESDRIIPLPRLEHVKIGRRLLNVSREALRRVFYLSYSWRMTGDGKYLARAEKELLAVCAFADWNPSHFLDTAEMTMAVAIGYDWLYGGLSENSRKIIREAIISKGLEPSFDSKYNWFVKSSNNWNQVCNGGMAYGALAVAEDTPELAKKVIDRALVSIRLPMEEYKPDGAYPEGYSYWTYGTSFNVMFLSAVERIFTEDLGFNKNRAFFQTPLFMQNMTGVTGQCFNWGDCGSGTSLNPTMFWFARRNNDPSVLWLEKKFLQKDDYSKFARDRLLPAVMLWGMGLPLDKVTEPKAKFWKGGGASPVCLMRTSWTDPNAIYLGFKAGSPSANHAHMDVGSFIMESDGVRWASDLGMQDYESLESKKISIWNNRQDGQRWSVFRLNNFSHSTLTVNGQLQVAKGYAKIDKSSDKPEFMFAVSDISQVYEKQLASARRGVAVVDGKFAVVSDELTAGKEEATVRWAMLTSAVPEQGRDGFTLAKDGKKLFMKVKASAEVAMKTWPTAPATSYDAPNPGTVLVGFEIKMAPDRKETVQVLLVPGSSADAGDIRFSKPLSDW